MKTEKISVTYLDHMGTDLTVVNAARASFDKTSAQITPADRSLIRFLALGFRTEEWDALADQFLAAEERADVQVLLRHYKSKAQHWAPFAHPQVQLRITAPIFVARQMVKHQVGAVWSEVSRRYVSDEPTFWLPDEWHARPGDIKQGAAGNIASQSYATLLARDSVGIALDAYMTLLRIGVAPEEARMVLPLNTMTTWVWTGSLAFWARVANQRLDGHAQLAAQETAVGIAREVGRLFPICWGELVCA